MFFPRRSGIRALAACCAIWFLTAGVASAGCYAPDQQLPQQQWNDFVNNPRQLLEDDQNTAGGAEMIARVRDLVASNPAALPLVLALLSVANPAQQTAIGTGLGQAASLCIRPDPSFASDIQAQLAAETSDDAKNAYAAVTGNLPIRGVANGNAFSGGSSGGSTGALPTPLTTSIFTRYTANSVANITTNYFTGSTSSATFANSFTNFTSPGTTTGGIPPSTSVSP